MEYAIKEIARVIGAKTNQLLDDTVSLLLTDSRRLSFPEKSLFFALKTKTNDGHRYIQELYKLRVRNFVVSDMLPEFESMKDANFLIVKDTLRALQKLATHHRKQFNIPVIGITGSNGKTIVKEFLYQLLHNEFNIVRSPRSYNSQLGVPLSVWQMSEKNTLGIFEAGISQPDEMERLQPIIAPTIGIITNIGEAHQENFLSSNQKCMEKLTLFNDCEAIIYDGDDLFYYDKNGYNYNILNELSNSGNENTAKSLNLNLSARWLVAKALFSETLSVFFIFFLSFLVVFALNLIKLSVFAASLQQFLMCSFFTDAAVCNHNDTVAEARGGKTVRNVNRGFTACHFIVLLVHFRFCDRIKRRRWLVKNNEWGILVKRTGKHKALRFATRKEHSIFKDLSVQIGIIPVLQGFDFLTKSGFLHAVLNSLHIKAFAVLCHIGCNRTGKE